MHWHYYMTISAYLQYVTYLVINLTIPSGAARQPPLLMATTRISYARSKKQHLCNDTNLATFYLNKLGTNVWPPLVRGAGGRSPTEGIVNVSYSRSNYLLSEIIISKITYLLCGQFSRLEFVLTKSLGHLGKIARYSLKNVVII